MTYKEMYLLLSEVNRKILGEEKSKEMAFKTIIYYYEYNTGKKHLDGNK